MMPSLVSLCFVVLLLSTFPTYGQQRGHGGPVRALAIERLAAAEPARPPRKPAGTILYPHSLP